MTQNIYDQDDFFKQYTQLPRQVQGPENGAPEWPALRTMIPNLQGSKVLDLGCGFGWVCRWSRDQGAVLVKGVDVSKNMLARAKEFPEDPAITYIRADLETLELPSSTYDLVFSSLAFHYLENLPTLIGQIYQSLKPGGALVFSVEHPIFTAPRNAKSIKGSTDNGMWPLDGYLHEGPRTTNWLADGIIKQHRTMSTYISMLLDAGLILSAIVEWGPTPEYLAKEPVNTTPFLLIKAMKPKG